MEWIEPSDIVQLGAGTPGGGRLNGHNRPRLDLDSNLPFIYVDPVPDRAGFRPQGLSTNAAQNIPPPASTIHGGGESATATAWSLSVHDTGVGLTDEESARSSAEPLSSVAPRHAATISGLGARPLDRQGVRQRQNGGRIEADSGRRQSSEPRSPSGLPVGPPTRLNRRPIPND